MRKWAAGFLILAAAVLFYVACGESPTAPGATAINPPSQPFPSGGGSNPFDPPSQPFPTGGPGTPPPSGSPSPSPSGSPTPSPSGSPTTPPPVVLQVTNLFVATGTPYEIVQSNDCCSNSMGRAWVDWPYVLDSNFGADPILSPLFNIRTGVADTNAAADPLMSFDINICATVHVIFGEKNSDLGCNDPYPSWIASGGWACSVQGCAGTVATFNHETLGTADQVFGPRCQQNFPAGTVQLGPREPSQGDPDDKMYTVFVKAPTFGPCP